VQWSVAPGPGAGYTPDVSTNLIQRPLARWDGFCLRLDLDMLELLAARELPARTEAVRGVRVAGEGERLEFVVTIAIKGLPAKVAARVDEIRVYRRFLGLRIASLRGPLGVPVPLGLVAMALRRFGPDFVTLDTDDGILLVDLRRWLPDGVQIEIRGVRCLGRTLEIELASGSVAPVFGAIFSRPL